MMLRENSTYSLSHEDFKVARKNGFNVLGYARLGIMFKGD